MFYESFGLIWYNPLFSFEPENIWFFFIGQDSCSFETLPFAVEVQYIGNVVGNIYPGSVDDCIGKCKQIKECQNFVYSKNKQECYFKDGILTGSEPTRSWDQQFSVYKSCKKGIVDHPYKTIEAIQMI